MEETASLDDIVREALCLAGDQVRGSMGEGQGTLLSFAKGMLLERVGHPWGILKPRTGVQIMTSENNAGGSILCCQQVATTGFDIVLRSIDVIST